jgi:hypothetical protein
MAFGIINAEQLTTQSGYTLGAGNASSFKNRIINGAMVIDQRNAGALITSPASGQYLVDRFWYRSTQTAKANVQQNYNSVTPPAGFINYLGVVSTSAYAVLNTDRFNISQNIEGLNVADLGWGAAGAATITLSFQVYSSLTGTFGGALQNSAGDRSYPFTYTISSSNTWTSISITIAGDTSGTWLKTNGIGIAVYWGLGAGSTTSGTAGAWAAAGYFSATGATSVVGTNGATFYITGVQLEVGTVATSFDYRSYGTELALCQRYYQKFTATASGQVFSSGMMNSTTTSRLFIPFLVPLRTNPTALEQTGTATDYALFHGATLTTCSAVPQFVVATVNGASIEATIASGGTAGNGTLFRAATSSAYLGWSAEL